ncbi:unnamed protein product [Musa acuminata subsp. malaccensis]|uniref:(wild Malaysian banana) hypothetical protein n=1 Tax=Musa acuminata subsp. malaccensis TaxID=214687 RepID=A0A804IMF4_MUSAM|nr:PREDICTED: probable WRKY transcription factor 65 [Musa acuminata subsp. malaccensis]CAG1841569.1 unnamed protein product [Musa acuminata subsp. malaccensis]
MTGSCSNEPGASEADEVGDASEANDGRPVSAGSTDDSQPVRSSAPCPKRCRRAVQKRVVTMPISEAKGGGEGAPPPDSWTWRKYGQKPIKGSPYPRGYYRCSSSKGCPARKQVERSRVDPAVIVVTYSFEHNHTWPVPRNHHHKHAAARPEEQLGQSGTPDSAERDEKFSDPIAEEESALTVDARGGFPWFADVCFTPSASPSVDNSHELLYGSVIFAGAAAAAALPEELEEQAAGGGGGAEEDSLFAGLGELPEYSVVLRRGLVPASWLGTTG